LKDNPLRTAVTLALALTALLWAGGFVLAQNSAMFDINAPIPSSAQAGKEIIFEVRITNTGIETWMSDEYFVLVRIFDANKNYLTETDKVRQFEDIGPGEVLTTEIPFDVPAYYGGNYYYTVALEFEDIYPLESSHFSLRISPIEKVKVVTGSLRIGHTSSNGSRPSTNIDLSLVNQLASKRSFRLNLSARNSHQMSEVNNYFFDYRSGSMNLSVGQISSALSYLTLRRLHGMKVETETEGMSFTVFRHLPPAQKASVANNIQTKNLYGARGAIQLTDSFTLAGNYAQSRKNRGSVASIEGDLALTPQFTISGEYAQSTLEENEVGKREDNAFRATVSRTSPKLSFNGLYQKVGRDFYSLENSGLVKDREEYSLSFNYRLGQYMRATARHNLYQDDVSQHDTVSRRTTGSMGLSFFFPKLPSLSISYGENTNLSAGAVNRPKNSITNTLTVGVSKRIGRAHLSVTQTQTDSQDRTKALSKRNTLSTTYKISTPLTKQLSLSTSYRDSSSRASSTSSSTHRSYITSDLKYTIIPTKLISSLRYAINESPSKATGGYYKTTTTLNTSYYFTRKDSLGIRYTIQDNRNLGSSSVSSSGSQRLELSCTSELTKNHNVSLRYSLMSRRPISTGNPQRQDIRLTYFYKF